MLSSLREDELTSALGLVLYPLVARHQPLKAGEIVTSLVGVDRNEILGLLESPPSLEAAINQVLQSLPDRGPLRLKPHTNPRLQPSPKSGHIPDPRSNAPVRAGASTGGDHNDDQEDS